MDGLPLKRTNALGHTFAYAYDKARRLTVLTNENGETYRLDYDRTDNLIQETGWDGKITAYGYDAAGQLVQLKKKVYLYQITFPQKDAVFLYHLKYDAYTKTVVKDITTKIIFSKGQERPHYRIPCWHDKPIMLSFYGIELGNSVLCC